MGIRRPVHGVGVNDAEYVTDVRNPDGTRRRCPFYVRWNSMLERCYSKKWQENKPTYKGCSVCPEWQLFSNFKAWMEQQDWEGKQLDKDLLFQNNKVYSHSTCVFVPHSLNSLLLDRGATRGEWPLGVTWDKQHEKFKSSVAVDGKHKHLGLFTTPEEAHAAWQIAKSRLIKEAAFEQSDPRVRDALLLRVAQLEDDTENNRETIKL